MRVKTYQENVIGRIWDWGWRVEGDNVFSRDLLPASRRLPGNCGQQPTSSQAIFLTAMKKNLRLIIIQNKIREKKILYTFVQYFAEVQEVQKA